jgi:lactate dehydrogenase-like 2-hydroxyacid dehydrogenase
MTYCVEPLVDIADGVQELDEATANEWYAEADALMMVGHVHVDAVLLDRCPKCAYVCSFAVGFDSIDVEECTRRNIYVSSGAGSITETTADVALFLLLGTTRACSPSTFLPSGTRCCGQLAAAWLWVSLP